MEPEKSFESTNSPNGKKDEVKISVPWASPENTSVSGGSLTSSEGNRDESAASQSEGVGLYEDSAEKSDISPASTGESGFRVGFDYQDTAGNETPEERKKKRPIEFVSVRDVSEDGNEKAEPAKNEGTSITEETVPVESNIVPAHVETVPVKPELVPVKDPESEKPPEKIKPVTPEGAADETKKVKPKEEKKPENAKARAASDEKGKPDDKEKEAKPEKNFELSETDRAKIAELLYGAIVPYNEKERAAALERLEKDFSPRAIQEAARFISIRDEANGIIEDWRGKKIPDEILQHRLLVRDNKYKPALIQLKRVLLEEKRKELEEIFKGRADLEDIIKEKLFLGRDGKGEGAYERVLLRMMITELERDIGVHEQVRALECPQNVGFVRRTLEKIGRMPRPMRAMLGAGIIGSGVAGAGVAGLFGLHIAVVAVPSYLLYRMVRAGTGGVFAAAVQKYIGNPFAQSKLKKYLGKDQEEVLGSAYREMGERGHRGRSILEEFADMKRYQDVAMRNFEISQKYARALHELRKKSEKKYGKVLAATSVVSGIAGGFLGAAALDAAHQFLFGPSATVLASDGLHHTIDTPPKGESTAWNFETAKPGDSVWRVIEHDLQRNVKGFDQLPKAQQTYLIDHYKDLVVADPQRFGLQNPNVIQPGWGKELRSLFEGKAGQIELDRWMSKASNLTPEQMQNITEYNMKSTVFHPDTAGLHTGAAEVSAHDAGAPPTETLEAAKGIDTTEDAAQHTAEDIPASAPLEHVMTRQEILLDLHDAVPHFAESAEQFPHLSLAAQEHILSSSRVASIANEMHQLNHIGSDLTNSEINIMGEINKHWGAMMQAYTENTRHFTSVLREATGLQPEDARSFLHTTVDKVLDVYKENEKVLDFMRNINPTSDELAMHVPVEDVLKNRFIDGHFGRVNLDQYVTKDWVK